MMNKYKLWIALALVGAFAAGFVGGIFIERSVLHPRWHSRIQRNERRAPDLEQMSRDLGLSAEQKEAIKKIFEGNDARLKELRTEMHNRLSSIRSEIQAQIDAVLTPEQKNRLEEIIAKHRERNKRPAEQKRPESGMDTPPEKPKGDSQ